MLQRKFGLLLTINYYHLLIYGLMPTTMRLKRSRMRLCKVSKGYLIYSLGMTGVLLLQFPYMFPHGAFGGYMKNNIILQGNLIANIILRVFACLSSYGLVWLQRKRLMSLYRDFLLHWRHHWPILRRVAGAEALQRMELQLARKLQCQLWVNYAMLLCSCLIQYQLITGMTLLNLLARACQMLMLSTIRIGFCTLLILLYHQFEAVLLSIQALQRRVGSRSLEDLHRIAAIHSEWVQLSQRAFSIYDFAIASVFANMFALNVNVLYHAIQYSNHTIKSGISGKITGDCLILFNVWNLILVMNLVDQTMNSCNNASYLLRHFNNLRRLSRASEMELELFMNRLRSNRLFFRICGCVVLDRPAFLSYLASVLNNIIIFIQFDLKRKQEMSETLIKRNK